jgi:predicted small lipoprotein YifL
MKRWIALLLCALSVSYAVTACGGAGDTAPDKLTIVGSGS